MSHIRLIHEAEATGELAEIYRAWLASHPGRPQVPGILKAFGARPDFLRMVQEFSGAIHFSDGHLPYRTKEMLATVVSALNQCPY